MKTHYSHLITTLRNEGTKIQTSKFTTINKTPTIKEWNNFIKTEKFTDNHWAPICIITLKN